MKIWWTSDVRLRCRHDDSPSFYHDLLPSIYFTIHPWPWPQTSAAKVTAHGHRPPATRKVAKQATTFRGFRQRSMGPKLGAKEGPRVKSEKIQLRVMMSQKRGARCGWWWSPKKKMMKTLPEYFVGLMVGNIPSKNNRIVGLIPGSLGMIWDWNGTRLFLKMMFLSGPGKTIWRMISLLWMVWVCEVPCKYV